MYTKSACAGDHDADDSLSNWLSAVCTRPWMLRCWETPKKTLAVLMLCVLLSYSEARAMQLQHCALI